MAAPPPSGAEHIEGAVHIEVLHETASTEVTPAPEGLGAGATNPKQPKTSNSKSGKYSLHSKYCRPQFKFKTFRPIILDKTIDYTLIICSTCAYLMKKHQNTPLNLPPRPQNNVEFVRNENNKTTLTGGGMGEVCSM